MILSILDTEFGNIGSLKNALDFLKIKNKIIRNAEDIKKADSIILPGDGSFKAIATIYEKKYYNSLCEHVKRKKPILGICLGMHFFSDFSEEDSLNSGFGWIPGYVKKIKSTPGIKVPHIGYNSIIPQFEHQILSGIEKNCDFYFIHSYYYEPKNKKNILATTEYGEKFCSLIIDNNIIGSQFHPEKSQQNGLIFLKNFYNFSLFINRA